MYWAGQLAAWRSHDRHSLPHARGVEGFWSSQFSYIHITSLLTGDFKLLHHSFSCLILSKKPLSFATMISDIGWFSHVSEGSLERWVWRELQYLLSSEAESLGRKVVSALPAHGTMVSVKQPWGLNSAGDILIFFFLLSFSRSHALSLHAPKLRRHWSIGDAALGSIELTS